MDKPQYTHFTKKTLAGRPMALASFSILVVFLLIGAGNSIAGVKIVREYRLHLPGDPKLLFRMTLTPEQDVLSFIPNDDGTWRLLRVRRWLDKEPIEDSLAVPSLQMRGREERSKWGLWNTELRVTPDGKFVLCCISAYSAVERQRKDLITVVSLAEFKIVTNLRSSALPQISGDSRTYHLNRLGRFVVNAKTSFPRHPGDDPLFGGAAHKLAILTVPELSIIDSCEYSEWMRSGAVVRRENESDCASLLQNYGTSSLDELSRSFVETDEAMLRTDEKSRPSECAFLTYESHISRDGRLRRELCTGGHRGFWGNFVVTNTMENIFSVETGQKLGSIKEPNDHPLQSRFAKIDTRDYLLVMEGGTRLVVYLITE
jgi:hypothetical protein